MKRIVLLCFIFCFLVFCCLSTTIGEYADRDLRILLREEAVRTLYNPAFSDENSGAEPTETTGDTTTASNDPALSVQATSIPDDEQDIAAEEHEKKAFTLMVYICGSDLESENGAASSDIFEMMYAGHDSRNMNVLLMTGGSVRWLVPDIPSDKKSAWEVCPEVFAEQIEQTKAYDLPDEQASNTILYCMREAMKPTVRDDAASMGNPQTLKEFLSFSQTYYPAEKYGLILWDHGAGPNQGVCVDQVFNQDLICILELIDALKDSPFAASPLEWIGFDACLMGSVEIAARLAPYAKYMIASEESEPGCGWNYSFISDIPMDKTGADTGKRIIDRYFDDIAILNQYASGENSATLSCIDLSGMEKLCSSGENLFRELDQELNAETYVDFIKAREKATPFGHTTGGKATFDYDLIDLNTYLEQLAKGREDLRNDMKKALQNSVSYTRSTIDGASGLSIYYPYFCPMAFPYFEQDYQLLSISDAYSSFVKHSYDLQTSTVQADWSGMNTDMPHIGEKDIRTIFMLNLTDDQARLLAEAKLQMFQKNNDAYIKVADVPNVNFDTDSGTLSAEYVHRALFISDKDGNQISPALAYTMEKDGYYNVEAELVAHDDSGNELRRSKVLLTLQKAADSDDAIIVSMEKWDDLLQCYSSRYGISVSDYDTLEIISQSKEPKEFANGTLLPWDEWSLIGEEKYICSITGGQKLVLLHDQLDQCFLYASFAIRDYQNHHYLSSLRSLVEKPKAQEASLQYDDKDALVLENATLSFNNDANGRSAVLTMDLKNLTDHEIFVRIGDVLVDQDKTDLVADLFGNGPNWGILFNETQRLILNIPADVLSDKEQITQIDFILTLEFEDASTKEIPATVLINVQEPIS